MVTKRGRAYAGRLAASGWCPDHAKNLYASRKDARKAGKVHSPGAHPNAYQCDAREGWHWGHLGPTVVRGAMDRASRYADVAT